MIDDIWGDPIHSYSRKEAIEDGFLIDVTSAAKEAGFKVPVAITSAAWADYVEWDDEQTKKRGIPQDESGRLWDVLWMLRVAIGKGPNRKPESTDQEVHFSFCVVLPHKGPTAPQERVLKALCHPGDEGEPVVTIMEVSES